MKKAITFIALAISISSLSSCKMMKKQSHESTSLANTEWTLVTVGDRKFEKLKGMQSDQIELNFQSDYFGTSDGCNAVSGAFKQEQNTITLSDFRSTRMYCDGIMEQLYNVPYYTVNTFEIKNNELKLLDAAKKVVAVYKKK